MKKSNSVRILMTILLLCGMMALLTGCLVSEEEMKETVKKETEARLKTALRDYYGLNEGDYQASVKEINTNRDGRGATWRILAGESSFTVVVLDPPKPFDNPSMDKAVFSDRYYDEFVDCIKKMVITRLGTSGVLEDAPFITYAGVDFGHGKMIPVTLIPDRFDTFLKNYEVDFLSGIRMWARICYDSEESFLTEDKVVSLREMIPLSSFCFERYAPSDMELEVCLEKHDYTLYEIDGQWRFRHEDGPQTP